MHTQWEFSFARKDLCFCQTDLIQANLSSTSFVLRYLFSCLQFLRMYMQSASNHVDSGHILDWTEWSGSNRSAISLSVEWQTAGSCFGSKDVGGLPIRLFLIASNKVGRPTPSQLLTIKLIWTSNPVAAHEYSLHKTLNRSVRWCQVDQLRLIRWPRPIRLLRYVRAARGRRRQTISKRDRIGIGSRHGSWNCRRNELILLGVSSWNRCNDSGSPPDHRDLGPTGEQLGRRRIQGSYLMEAQVLVRIWCQVLESTRADRNLTSNDSCMAWVLPGSEQT